MQKARYYAGYTVQLLNNFRNICIHREGTLNENIPKY